MFVQDKDRHNSQLTKTINASVGFLASVFVIMSRFVIFAMIAYNMKLH